MIIRLGYSVEERRAIKVWKEYVPKISNDNNKESKMEPIKLGDERVDELLSDIINALAGDYEGWIKGGLGGKYSNINTYPWGQPSGIFDTLWASCLGEMTLKEVLDYIKKWCGMSLNQYPRGHNKHVILVTDKWDENIFFHYSDEFRNLAMREDFWFFIIFKTSNAWLEIPFLSRSFYKLTRHAPDGFYKLDDYTENGQLNNDNIFKDGRVYSATRLPVDFFFEGIAHFRTLPGGKSSICLFLENNKYCIICGTYYFLGEEHAVLAIGIRNDERKIYSALEAGYAPIYCKNGLSAMSLVRVAKLNPKILPIP